MRYKSRMPTRTTPARSWTTYENRNENQKTITSATAIYINQQISTNINNQYIVNIQTATSMTRDFELQQFISYRAIQHETNIQQSNILCKIWSREVLNPFHFKGERGLFHNSIRNIRDVDSKRRFDLALERRYFSRESRACWSWSIFNIDQHGMIKPY